MAARRVREKPTPAEIRSRGQAAAGELVMVDDAFDTVRARLFEEFLATKPADTDKRERIYHTLFAIASARAVLVEAVNAGKLQEQSDAISEVLNGR